MEERTNVGDDGLSDEDRRSMDKQLEEWVEAGCPCCEEFE